MQKYRFILNSKEVFPIYSSDLALEYSRESNQQFYRKTLNRSLKFLGQDFVYIVTQPFETEFVLQVQAINNNNWSDIYVGYFYKTDCTIDYDYKKVEVKPNAKDEYTDILAGLEKEYNLVELKPKIENVNLQVRSLLQIYQPGESVISCFVGNLFWEQDCEAIDNAAELIGTYNFTKALEYYYLEIFPSSMAFPDVSGRYILTTPPGNTHKEFLREDGKYKATKGSSASIAFSIYEVGGSEELIATAEPQDYDNPHIFPWPVVSTDTSLLIGQLDWQDTPVIAYSRILSNNAEKEGTRKELTSEDMCGYNRNYKYSYAQAPKGDIIVSSELSNEPTEWGIYQPGKYYVRPNRTVSGYLYYPIARTRWDTRSFWFGPNSLDIDDSEGYSADKKIRDAYPLAAAIKVLLAKVAPNLQHEETEEYSQFLYGERQGETISYKKFRLMICQKTNLINGEYQQPAQKAAITLSAIFEMLANMYQCYWYIEDNKLKIEHIRFFKNGNSYDSQSVGLDTTKIIALPNGLPWSFKTSKISYEKEAMPERYEFSQMDEVTDIFQGNPIDINSKYVEAGKIEDKAVSMFSTDVDYMQVNPNAINNDGFALFAVDVDANNTVSRWSGSIAGIYNNLQNSGAAMALLQERFWIYDLPGRYATINEKLTQALGITRNKKQTISCPVDTTFDINKLVKTELGDGQVEKMSLNLTTRFLELTLVYDTDS